jgi:hypothetical protein
MGDVFALVYNFHIPLSLKVKSVHLGELLLYTLGLYLLVCWSDGYFLWCYVLLQFLFCSCEFAVPQLWCGVSRPLLEFLRQKHVAV